jgi:hypothetical protein
VFRVLQSLTLSAIAAVLAPWAQATTSRATPPVGFMRYEMSPGLQTVGFPLMNTATASSRVEAIDATSLFATEGTEIGPRLDPALAYYLEFTAAPDGDTPFVGDRIEIDVAGTVDAANPPHRIRVQPGSALSTLHVLPESLVGYRFVIRAHVTLGSVLGTGTNCPLQSGENTEDAAQAYLLQNGVYQSFIFSSDNTTGERHWVKFPEGNIADDLPIAPGRGLFVRHVGFQNVTLRHVGHVRTNVFVQPLDAGNTLVSEPFPVENTFETRGMTAMNGFVAGESVNAADSVSVWTGESYHTLYYAANAGAAPAWRNADTIAQSTASENETAFSPFRAVLVQKLAADPDYVVPSTL